MQKRKNNDVFEMLSMIGQVTVTMLVPIIFCTFVGMWIGDKLGINWIAVVGFILGCVIGYESVYKIVKKYLKNKKQ